MTLDDGYFNDEKVQDTAWKLSTYKHTNTTKEYSVNQDEAQSMGL